MTVNNCIQDSPQAIVGPEKIDGLVRNSISDSDYSNRRCQRILIYQGNRILPIDISKILMICTDDENRFIRTADQVFLCSHSIERMEQLCFPLLFRVSRQFLISFESIDQIYTGESGRLFVKLIKPICSVISVSRRRISSFIHWIETGEILA